MKKALLIAVALPALFLAGCGTTSNGASSTSPTTAPTNNTNSTTGATTNTNSSMNHQYIYLTVRPGGKLGPDGKDHDAFSPANFTLVEGVPTTVTIYNYDNMKHSITNSALGINFQAKPSSKNGQPGVKSFTFTPNKAGSFTWNCVDPCDTPNNGWSMSHKGYMMGTIKVVPDTQPTQDIALTVMPGGKLGSDGKLHDAFSPANFTVEKGIPVKLTIYNYDNMKHSITNSALGINFQAKPSTKKDQPGVKTFTFTPKKDGSFTWNCVDPCDTPNGGWSMSHSGYMMGTIKVVG
ncbi:hypothetical protein [Alicyclobacillus sp. SO9]|uniref:hypothetical protein n=1 Tax=Alicyclobacillus sp. SO9 TaxID=2665646 RepID=UPI0018E78888|nr:hypothetical protein [Alicyclobacillus sp. SO9]QQE78318.1 hypothetical protein GI364_20955 [Alicyclobacillus sp. SO9]